MLSHFQNEFRTWEVVQSEKEPYQGMPSGCRISVYSGPASAAGFVPAGVSG
jgi:hypothetical protein